MRVYAANNKGEFGREICMGALTRCRRRDVIVSAELAYAQHPTGRAGGRVRGNRKKIHITYLLLAHHIFFFHNVHIIIIVIILYPRAIPKTTTEKYSYLFVCTYFFFPTKFFFFFYCTAIVRRNVTTTISIITIAAVQRVRIIRDRRRARVGTDSTRSILNSTFTNSVSALRGFHTSSAFHFEPSNAS